MDKVKEVTKLAALNLRMDQSLLEDLELVKLVNFDVARKPGSLALRRGKEYLLTTSPGEVVRQVAKVNGTRYQVAGSLLYRNGVALASDLASGLESTVLGNSKNQETNFQAFRPLNDTHIWALIADDNYMTKDDGTNHYLWGIDLIPTPKPQVCNQTGKKSTDTITAGTYTIAVTQLRWDITESNV
jgi:hypothetical protein